MQFPSFSTEFELLKRYSFVGGVDEVGRGCLAGPVVACVALVANETDYSSGVRDSKTMSASQREKFADRLRVTLPYYAIGEASAEEIDSLGIRRATYTAMLRAYWALPVAPEIILMDGESATIPILSKTYQYNYGDARFFSIAAASILAKVYRDNLLVALDSEYPGYGFAAHKGYGTAAHYEALRKLGMTPIHRRSFTHL